MAQSAVPRQRCPRCGVRLDEAFKFCPNCAYRLRPDLVSTAPAPQARIGRGTRLLALGGYLAFASLLLLVALAGILLFVERSTAPILARDPTLVVVEARDRDRIPLTRESFAAIEGGKTFKNVYLPDEELRIEPVFVDDDFLLMLHEVTNDQYYAFLRDRVERTGAATPIKLVPDHWDRPTGEDDLPRIYPRGDANLPVVGVDFYAAMEFCAWVWETLFHADPDVVVDLPTDLEFIRAGRGDEIELNYPWGLLFDSRKARFRDRPGAVDRAWKGGERRLVDLVGNAAEWVHVPDRWPAVAGGSFRFFHLPDDVLARFVRQEISFFHDEGFRRLLPDTRARDVGFRVAVRQAPARPAFVSVESGPVRFADPPRRPLPPRTERGVRREPIHLASETEVVRQPFEMARTEITNRQYLAFVTDFAERASRDTVATRLPYGWGRTHPFGTTSSEREPAFRGPYGDFHKIERIYWPGEENLPVEGVTLEQAQQYVEWRNGQQADASFRVRLPTYPEFVRAGRGNGTEPYPWGDDPASPRLVCAGRADDEQRAVSLLGRLSPNAPALVGLAGNLPELVFDPEGQRWLLAGGCYAFPAAYCTLDSVLDAEWEWVEIPASIEPGTGIADFATPVALGDRRGFRVVRVRGW